MSSSASGLAVLEQIGREFEDEHPLRGTRVLMNMHLTRETAVLGETLRAADASVLFHGSNRNPASEAILGRVRGCGTLCRSLDDAAALDPHYVIEGNGRVFRDAHERPAAWPSLSGISMHTSGGGSLVDHFDAAALRLPVVAVYRHPIKQQWETGLGTAQSVLAALLRALQRPVAGRTTLVIGFGNVGSGVARFFRAAGSRVVVAEIRDEAKLRARFEGFRVVSIEDGLREADLCLTTTGRADVITGSRLAHARAGITLANVSNEPREIQLTGCVAGERSGPWLQAWTADGNRLFLLGDGIQVNHVVEAGNPAELMDLSLSLHALIVPWLVESRPGAGVYDVPESIAQRVAVRYFHSLS